MLIKYNFLFGVLLHICVVKIYFGSLCVLTERCVRLTDIAQALLNEKIYLGFERRKESVLHLCFDKAAGENTEMEKARIQIGICSKNKKDLV